MSGEIVQSFSICLPSGCNASCPFCISQMTGIQLAGQGDINVDKFRKACELAKIGRCTTVMLTGKGEPTLYRRLLDRYLYLMKVRFNYTFPIIELQTNGIVLYNDFIKFSKCEALKPNSTPLFIESLIRHGLTGVSISVVHFDNEVNKQVYTPNRPEYIDLRLLVSRLKELGVLTRVNCTMIKGWIDCPDQVSHFLYWAWDDIGFDQVTLRPIAVPSSNGDDDKSACLWTEDKLLSPDEKNAIRRLLTEEWRSELIRPLVHGAEVLALCTYRGVKNVCLTNCLTRDVGSREELRQLIYLPNQTCTTDWEYADAARLF